MKDFSTALAEFQSIPVFYRNPAISVPFILYQTRPRKGVAYISMTIAKQFTSKRELWVLRIDLELKVRVINVKARYGGDGGGWFSGTLEKQSAWPTHAYSTAKYLQAFLIMIISSEGTGFEGSSTANAWSLLCACWRQVVVDDENMSKGSSQRLKNF